MEPATHPAPWLVTLFALALAGLPDRAAAQPCGGYESTAMPEDVLAGLIDDLREADAAAAEAGAAPSRRIAAYHRIAGAAERADDAYSICNVPAPEDEERFRAATGRELARPLDWRNEAWTACAAVVAATHASGDEARTCVRRGAHPLRPLAPKPPATWCAAGADDGARMFDELRGAADEPDAAARTDLAAICLAAGDWQGAFDLAAPLAGTYDGDLLQAAALAGRGEGEDAARIYRDLVSREPGRPEAHFNLALLAASRWYWPMRGPAGLRAPFLHALAYLCLTDPADDPELADAATGFARNLEEALTGRSAWIWRTEDREQPPLPLPIAKLGPLAQGFPAETPIARTCDDVLREAAPGLAPAGTD